MTIHSEYAKCTYEQKARDRRRTTSGSKTDFLRKASNKQVFFNILYLLNDF